MIGILGGGQLGRMLALAGHALGESFRVLDPSEDATAGVVAEHVHGSYTDQDALQQFARDLKVVTYEFENVPVETTEELEKLTPVYPPPSALRIAQDRLAEKSMCRELGINTPSFLPVDNLDELHTAIETVGLPAVLKTRRLGYDGKGQTVIHSAAEVPDAWTSLGKTGLILESFVPFDRELSIIAVRNRKGDCRFYPLIQNHHSQGILRVSIAPAPQLTLAIEKRAEDIARAVLERLHYVGTLAIELFDVKGELLVNELAPRVHNTGHWTIEGAETSQFENHLRAIIGLPLGSTSIVAPSTMVNLIGKIPPIEEVLSIPGVHVHLYGKEPRPGRKVGHVTIRQTKDVDFAEAVRKVRVWANE